MFVLNGCFDKKVYVISIEFDNVKGAENSIAYNCGLRQDDVITKMIADS